MTNENINCHEYAKVAQAFYPHNFNAHQWITAIKKSGARYITFTTRHHEGFSMWDTKQSDYNIMHTPYGKDIVKQLVDECHRQQIGIHLYWIGRVMITPSDERDEARDVLQAKQIGRPIMTL